MMLKPSSRFAMMLKPSSRLAMMLKPSSRLAMMLKPNENGRGSLKSGVTSSIALTTYTTLATKQQDRLTDCHDDH